MFFTAAMICHGELVRRRPGARHLTQFYLLMSVGGVLGGLFNTMVAPAVFTRILEYPLVMALACLVLPRTGGAPDSARDRRRDLVLPIILAAVAAGGLLLIRTTILARVGWVPMVLGVGLLLACFTFKARPVRFGLSYVVLLLAILFLGEAQAGNTLYAERNFFGVKRAIEAAGPRKHHPRVPACRSVPVARALLILSPPRADRGGVHGILRPAWAPGGRDRAGLGGGGGLCRAGRTFHVL
jgi:hypothetical protein